ncbi:MAG: 30S ribosomal protein S27e [Nitrosopumilus sp.]|nr:30S ribosomal protein S27e [Nitrosopumilus sp.]MDH3385290.1 30S ribosomal protein S27e [Nitrosopumilus sp.]
MKKDHIEIPKPASKFQKVDCGECGEQQVVYSHASTTIACNSCGNTLAEPTGSKATINGKISGSAE